MILLKFILSISILLFYNAFANCCTIQTATDSHICAGPYQPALSYLKGVLTKHRITIIGEPHLRSEDVELIADILPFLHENNISLAVECFSASMQPEIDLLITSPKWDSNLANKIMRLSDWPYIQYRNILEISWKISQNKNNKTLKIIALGPTKDWRIRLIPKGITYDSFMTEIIQSYVKKTSSKVLIYCGMHHAFTRYQQADVDLKGVVRNYMLRLGNLLYKDYGDAVFCIALHSPQLALPLSRKNYVLPFSGQIDCLMDKNNWSIGFNISESDISGLQFLPNNYYSIGHPGLKFSDFADGYIALVPVEKTRLVDIIPLSDLAPDMISFEYISNEDPFTGTHNLSRRDMEQIWKARIDANNTPLLKLNWAHLVNWRIQCK